MEVAVLREKIHKYINIADERHLSAIYLLIEDNYEGVTALEAQFNKLAAKWKEETGVFGTTYQKIINDAYLDIIALGKDVVPFILKDLENGPAHWHTALKALTKENPVPDEDLNKSKKIRESWLAWGRDNNFV